MKKTYSESLSAYSDILIQAAINICQQLISINARKALIHLLTIRLLISGH